MHPKLDSFGVTKGARTVRKREHAGMLKGNR